MAEIARPSAGSSRPIHGSSLWRDAANRLRRNPSAMVGLFLIGTFVIVAIFAPLIAPYSPTEGSIIDRFKPPSLSPPARHRPAGPGHPLADHLRGAGRRCGCPPVGHYWPHRRSHLRRDQRLRRRLARLLDDARGRHHPGPAGTAPDDHDRHLPRPRPQHDRLRHRRRERADLRPHPPFDDPRPQGERLTHSPRGRSACPAGGSSWPTSCRTP